MRPEDINTQKNNINETENNPKKKNITEQGHHFIHAQQTLCLRHQVPEEVLKAYSQYLK